MPRLLSKSWIRSWISHMEKVSESPSHFHWWSGISAIGASMRRNVWFDRVKYRVYPNQFVVLVAQPGVGKGSAINPAVKLLHDAGTANMMSDRLSVEHILDRVSRGWPITVPVSAPPVTIKISPLIKQSTFTLGVDHSAFMSAEELSVFIKKDSDCLPSLNRLWDSTDTPLEYGTVTHGLKVIEKPCFSILAGDQPRHIVKSLPHEAVGGGFVRRVNFIYAKVNDFVMPFPSNHSQHEYNALVDDLKYIHTNVKGEFVLDNIVKPRFQKFYESSKPDEFEMEVVQNYKSSKWVHALKAAMCLSAAYGEDMVIRKEDWEEAEDHVQQVCDEVPVVFQSVGESPLVESMEKIRALLKSKGGLTQRQIMSVLYRDIGDQFSNTMQPLMEAGHVREIQQSGAIQYIYTGP